MTKDETLQASLKRIKEIIKAHDKTATLYQSELNALDEAIHQFNQSFVKQRSSLFEVPECELKRRHVVKCILIITQKIEDEFERIDKENQGVQYYPTLSDEQKNDIKFKNTIKNELIELSKKIAHARPEIKDEHMDRLKRDLR